MRPSRAHITTGGATDVRNRHPCRGDHPDRSCRCCGSSRSPITSRKSAGRSTANVSPTSAARSFRDSTSSRPERLTRDVSTTPVLTIDGRSIGDSTRIIAAIEERWPHPPLYPEDGAQRRRALELEEFFDEELGPHLRRAFYHELLPHPELVVPLFTDGRPRHARILRAGFPLLRAAMRQRFEISAESAATSRAKMVAAMDRLERETSTSGYLVGDSFTVADLTAAALFYPVARPPEFPVPDGRRPRPARFVARVRRLTRPADPAADGLPRSTSGTAADPPKSPPSRHGKGSHPHIGEFPEPQQRSGIPLMIAASWPRSVATAPLATPNSGICHLADVPHATDA